MTSDADKRGTRIEIHRFKDLQSLTFIPEPKEPFTKAQTPLREGSRSLNHLPEGFKRERTAFPEGEMIERRAGSQDLIIPKAADAVARPHEYVKMKYESPRQSLQKVYELKLDSFIAVAIRKLPSCELVTVNNFIGFDRDEKVKRLRETNIRTSWIASKLSIWQLYWDRSIAL